MTGSSGKYVWSCPMAERYFDPWTSSPPLFLTELPLLDNSLHFYTNFTFPPPRPLMANFWRPHSPLNKKWG